MLSRSDTAVGPADDRQADRTPERRRRVFFALWPEDSLRDQLEHDLRKIVRRAGGAVVPARNLHVTLVFVGGVDSREFEAARAAAQTVDGPAFDLVFDRVETWPRQHLLCLTPTVASDALHDLAIELRTRLESRGFEVERRPFRAHVTLARKVNRPKATVAVELPSWPVRDFALVESVAGPHGSEYCVLDRFALQGEAVGRKL